MFLLINSPTNDPRKNSYPLGLSYIAAAIKSCNADVLYLDFSTTVNETDLINILLYNNIFFVGFTVCSDSFYDVCKLARIIKYHSPSTLVGIGGSHASYQSVSIISKYMEIDIAFIGAGETSIIQIAKNYKKNTAWYNNVPNIVFRDLNNKIISSEYKKYDYDIIPNREIINESDGLLQNNNIPIVSIDSSRGCIGDCSFCCLKVNKTPKLKCRNINTFEYEMKDISIKYKDRQFDLYITDADFLCIPNRVKKILPFLKSIKNMRYIIISARSDSIIKCQDMINELFETGCSIIELGIESASQTQLDRYGKNISVSKNFEAVELLLPFSKLFKAKISIDLIPFDPYVTINELKDTYLFMEKYFYGTAGFEQALFTRMTLYPNTALYNIAVQDSLLFDNQGGEPPYWRFRYEDSSEVYKWILAFQKLIYPNIIKYRKFTESEILNLQTSVDQSSIKQIYNRKLLNDIPYKYYKDILYNDKRKETFEHYKSIIENIINY